MFKQSRRTGCWQSAHFDHSLGHYIRILIISGRTEGYFSPTSTIQSAAPPAFRFGENILGGGPSRGCGRGAPQDARKFWKFPKKFSWKLQKMDYFRRFFKIIKNSALHFRALDENPDWWEIFEKMFKDFFEKSTKIHYFGLFWIEFQNPALNFRAFWLKT